MLRVSIQMAYDNFLLIDTLSQSLHGVLQMPLLLLMFLPNSLQFCLQLVHFLEGVAVDLLISLVFLLKVSQVTIIAGQCSSAKLMNNGSSALPWRIRILQSHRALQCLYRLSLHFYWGFRKKVLDGAVTGFMCRLACESISLQVLEGSPCYFLWLNQYNLLIVNILLLFIYFILAESGSFFFLLCLLLQFLNFLSYLKGRFDWFSFVGLTGQSLVFLTPLLNCSCLHYTQYNDRNHQKTIQRSWKFKKYHQLHQTIRLCRKI